MLLRELKSAKQDLYTEYGQHYAPKPSSSSAANLQLTSQTPSAFGASPKKQSFLSRLSSQQVSSDLRSELDIYFLMTASPLPAETTDLLGWWHLNRNAFPNLYKMARDIHCIPGML
jgi:hypothetical protein